MAMDATYENLSAALAAGRFPDSVVPQAQTLCDTLTAPARITLLGMPGTGKTGVLNLLAGARVVPDPLELGTIRVEYGAGEETEITMASGESAKMDGLPNPASLEGIQPVLTRITAPLPALGKISLLEVGLGNDPTGQARAIKWAAKQTDIAIWCTTGFSDAEDALWQTTPDRMRDHGIMLYTKIDQLGDARIATMNDLHHVAGAEFAYALGVSVQEANAASANGSVDKEMMRSSGGMKLISTILKEIETGRQNLVDQADVLLRMHPETVVTAKPQPAPVVKADPEPQPAPKADAAPVRVEEDSSTPEAVVIAFDAAVQRLSGVGTDLSATQDPDTDSVLDASMAVLNWLGEHLEDSDLPDIPVVSHAQAMTQDAEDLVQLMRMEGTQTGRDDAIIALLQLKRGFQTALAA